MELVLVFGGDLIHHSPVVNLKLQAAIVVTEVVIENEKLNSHNLWFCRS